MKTPKIALITGANKGLGLEVARQLASKGWKAFLGARDASAGKSAAESVGGAAEFIDLDVTDSQRLTRAAQAVSKKVDHLDVLVNNAGILVDRDNSVLTLSPEMATKTFDTNTLGPLRVTQAFLSLLQKSRAPRIINVSSGAGQLSGELQSWAPAYSISKTALNALTQQLAAALPDFAVNSVCPGWVRTSMGGSSAPRSVEEGADTIVWLADEAPQDLTAKSLRDREVIDW